MLAVVTCAPMPVTGPLVGTAAGLVVFCAGVIAWALLTTRRTGGGAS